MINTVYSQGGTEPFHEHKTDKTYSITYTDNPPSIDGLFNDHCWENSLYISEFLQDEPYNLEAATERTTVRIVYDDEALYIAATMYDSEPDKIDTRLSKRDDWIKMSMADWFSIELDSRHDHQTAFGFWVNASGVQVEGMIYDDGSINDNWNANWESEVIILNDGWHAEMKIPFSVLRFNPSNSMKWGMNLYRYIHRKNEEDAWVVLPRETPGYVSKYGHITKLENVPNPVRLEVSPYIFSGVNTYNDIKLKDPDKDTLGITDMQMEDERFQFGMDFKYWISNNSTFDLTINPDFGQIESDPGSINLSYYETYFTEKRPFFLENSTMFDTPIEVFYSRRIGMNNTYVDTLWGAPKSAIIKTAAKITGKSRSGLSYGLISAITTDQIVGTWLSKMETGPQTQYWVGRMTQDIFDGNSYVGIIGTHFNHQNKTESNMVAIDLHSYFLENKFKFNSQFVSSTRNDIWGRGLIADAEYFSEELIDIWFRYEYFDKEFDINDVGYLWRNNLIHYESGIEFKLYEPAYFNLRKSIYGLQYKYINNLDKTLLENSFHFYWDNTFKNYSYTGLAIEFEKEHYDDYLLYDFKEDTLFSDLNVKLPETIGASIYFGSDPDQVYYFDYYFNYAKNVIDDYGWNMNLTLGYNPVYHTQLSFRYSIAEGFEKYHVLEEISEDGSDDEVEFVFTESDNFIERYQYRINRSVNQDLSLQLYAEYYTNHNKLSEQFSIFRKSNDFSYPEEEYDYGEYYHFDDYDEETDSEKFLHPYDYVYHYAKDQLFNMNFVLTWEYRPGSNIYFVYSIYREVTGEKLNSFYDFLNYSPNDQSLSELYFDQSLFIKIDYWFN